jgi:ubiquinone/menaquinone biosynthesis C-methylase UbiE
MRRESAVLALLAATGCLQAACTGAARHAPAPTGHHRHDATVHHSFADAERWAGVFDDPNRDRWQQPAAVVEALAITPGMTVADVGAGTGYFMPYLTAAVGEHGTVLAVDVEPSLVAHLRQRAETAPHANVVPILGSFDTPRIPAGSADLILFVDTIHHVDARPAYFRRLQGALRPGGRVAIVDFKKEPAPVGPPLAHKLARSQVEEEMTLAGYELIDAPDILAYQYLLVFRPRAQEHGSDAR